MRRTEIPEKEKIISDWVESYGDQMYATAYNRTSNTFLAQDIVQESFISAWLNFDSFQHNASPKTWLFTILKNKIIDHYRQKARNIILTLNDDSFNHVIFDENGHWIKTNQPKAWPGEDANLAHDDEFNKVLKQCIDELPKSWVGCIELKYFADMKSEDICQELGISTSNYWQIMHRAKLKMRHCLEQKWFTVPDIQR